MGEASARDVEPGTGGGAGGGPRPHGWASAAAAALLLVALSVIVVLAWAAVRDVVVPGPGLFGQATPLVVTVYGVPLTVSAAVAAAAAWPLRHRLRRSSTVVAVTATAAALALAVPVVVLLAATVEAGGAVNLVEATVLSTTPPEPPYAYPVYLTTAEGQQLHLAVVRAVAGARPAPVIVFVHGGGWSGGSELGRLSDMHHWAGAGWLVVSVQYTLATPGHPTWDVAGQQVACALSRVAAGARGQGGDPGRVILAGDSAGGQLAVSVAYHAASHSQASACGGPVPVPGSVIAEYPAVDLVDGFQHGARSSIPSLDAPGLAISYTGGTPSQVPERYRAISGLAAITPDAPPTLVLGPADDALVPPAGVARFVGAARAAELVRVPFADHAFDTFQDGSLGHQAALTIMQHWSRDRVGL